jgi:hypothetical protein
VTHDELHRRQESAERRRVRRKREHPWHAEEELRLDLIDDVLRGSFPVLAIGENRAEEAGTWRSTEADKRKRRLDVFRLVRDRLDLLEVFIGVLHRGPFRRDHEREEESAIVSRYELLLERVVEQDRRRGQQRTAGDDDGRATQ